MCVCVCVDRYIFALMKIAADKCILMFFLPFETVYECKETIYSPQLPDINNSGNTYTTCNIYIHNNYNYTIKLFEF